MHLRLVTALTLLASALSAQARQITVQNLAPYPRQDWVRAVVPFAKGEVPDLPNLHAGKGPTVWQPFGARWPDGSLRQALCLFPVQMRALTEIAVPLEKGPGVPIPETELKDPLQSGLASLSCAVTFDGKTTAVQPRFVRALETNAARVVHLYRARVGTTGIVFELIVTSFLGNQHSEIDVGVFFSDPTSKAMERRFDAITIASEKQWLAFRHAPAFALRTEFADTSSSTELLRDLKLGDGQGIRRLGVLAPRPNGENPLQDQTHQAAVLCSLWGATPWVDSGAYGPFGFIPETPRWLQGTAGRRALAQRHARFARQAQTPGDPMQRLPLMLMKFPGATGDQMDFGVIKMTPVVATGLPSFLHEVEFSCLQEACRPVHFFESDATPVQVANHPQWITWNSRTHWNCGVSPDRLGKPCPAPKFESHGWQGKDRQHWSSNYLCGYYLLTGSHWARREIENEIQLFLSIQTVHDVPTSGTGAARAVGRMLHAGCWLYQCTGDTTLLKRLEDRLEKVYLKTWSSRGLGPDRVRPIFVQRPQSHVLGGETQFWIPWEESIAAIGLEAAYRCTGNAAAKKLAAAISLNVLRHGWVVDKNTARVGYRVAFQPEGQPIADDILAQQPETKCRLGGGGLAQWSIGAVEIARYYAVKQSDEFMVAKAQRILALLRRAGKKPSRELWLNKFRDWDAVRMPR